MPETLSSDLRYLADRTRRLLQDELRPLEEALAPDPNVAGPPGGARAGARDLAPRRPLHPDPAAGARRWRRGPLALTVVRETIAAAHLRVARWVLGPDPGALREAQGELRRLYLEPVLRGEKQGAFAVHRAARRAGADARDSRRRRVRGRTGTKSYVTAGADADFFLTVVRVVEDGSGAAATASRRRRQSTPSTAQARSGGSEASSAPGEAPASSEGGGSRTALLAIDRDLPGVEVAREFASLEGGRHVALRFRGARVPVSRVVGAIGEGMPRALRQIGDTRLAVAAFAVGSSQWAIDFVTRHLRAPHRRGAPLGDLESIRLRYGELRVQVYAARSVLYRTARLAAAGGNVVNETMIAKVLATETLATVADQAIQLVGGDALVVGHSARAALPRGALAAAGGGSERPAATPDRARGARARKKGRL
jgi:alkylation response protein AidB-like acyl-CoA dehydrogenase